jgi:hypothetical protein
MPRLHIDYSNIVIYKIVCNDLSITDCYVGHTTDFIRRKQSHKYFCTNENNKKKNNYKVYATIRKNGEWDNYCMIEIEKYPCKDANEASAKEREWFEILNSLNTHVPNGMSRHDYKTDSIQYHKDNRDILLLQSIQYPKNNRDQILIRKKQYYDNNRQKVMERANEKFMCQCGKEHSRSNKSYHFKTIFHLQYMNSLLSTTIPITTIDDDTDRTYTDA